MKKAKIYNPNKNPMQSGIAKNNKWILEFKNCHPIEPLKIPQKGFMQ